MSGRGSEEATWNCTFRHIYHGRDHVLLYSRMKKTTSHTVADSFTSLSSTGRGKPDKLIERDLLDLREGLFALRGCSRAEQHDPLN